GGVARRGRGAGGGGQVIVVPGLGAAPQLVDVPIAPAVDDVLGALGVEHVPGGVARRGRGAGRRGQVVALPARGLAPPQLMDMPIASAVDDMLGAHGHGTSPSEFANTSAALRLRRE